MTGRQLLDSLAKARWGIARRTYGNDHATLIGLLVDWWVSVDEAKNSVLEGSPLFDLSDNCTGKKGHCDAVLCHGNNAVGVVEVEGVRQKYTAEKVGSLLASTGIDLKTVRFGILLLYQSGPRGHGPKKNFPRAASLEALTAVAQLSAERPDRDFIVIELEKQIEHSLRGIRAISPYYCGRVSKVHASWYRGGQVRDRRIYAEESL